MTFNLTELSILTQLNSSIDQDTRSVSCGPRSRRAKPAIILTGRTKTQFLRIRNFVLLAQNQTIFAVEMPATVSTLYSNFQLNRARRFRDQDTR